MRYASLLVGLVLSVLIARAVGPTGRGQYYFPLLVVQTLQAVLHLSFDTANVFLVSQRRAPWGDLVGHVGMIGLLMGVAGVSVGMACWLTLRHSLLAEIPLGHFALALAPLILAFHQQYLAGLLLLRGSVITIQAIALTGAVSQLALIAGLILFSGHAVAVGGVLAVNCLTALLLWALTARAGSTLGPLRPRWRPEIVMSAMRFGLRIHIGAILLHVGARLDAYSVKHFLGLTALGYYSLAIALADLVTVSTEAVASAFVARQAELEVGDAAHLTARACRLNLALSFLLSLGLAVGAYPLILMAYGREFLPSMSPLLFLLPGVAVAALTRPLAYHLVRLDRPLSMSGIIAMAMAASLGLNVALTPVLGTIGSAMAASLSSATVAFGFLIWFQRHSGLPLRTVLWPTRADVIAVWRAVRLAGR